MIVLTDVLKSHLPDNYDKARRLLELDGVLLRDADSKAVIFDYVDDA